MAYTYPEDRIVSGEVIDPRPINRTLGRYYAEFDGMLDRDNFELAAFTDAKIQSISGTNTSSTVSLQGPCRQLKAWRATTIQDFLAGSTPCQHTPITGDVGSTFGGNIITLDSSLAIDFSCWYNWDDQASGAGAPTLGQVAEFYLTVDGLIVDTTGPVYVPNTRACVHLCPYIPVGAGTHTITAWVMFYMFNSGVVSSSTANSHVNERELIAKEVRR